MTYEGPKPDSTNNRPGRNQKNPGASSFWTHRHLRAAAIATLLLLNAASNASEMSGYAIVSAAQEAAGGALWRDAKSLKLKGHAQFFRNGQQSQRSVADSYTMWRMFPDRSEDAHAANGKVRFDAKNAGKVLFQISFDGQDSYDQNGLIDDASATERWKSNFGFGIFRFALRDGFEVQRMADDSIESHPCYFVQVRDPGGRPTLFAVDQNTFAIRMVGFDTPRGFHHRVYDDFSTHPGEGFVQPGSVRLYYDGVKTADIRWSEFEVNPSIDPQTFALQGPNIKESE